MPPTSVQLRDQLLAEFMKLEDISSDSSYKAQDRSKARRDSEQLYLSMQVLNIKRLDELIQSGTTLITELDNGTKQLNAITVTLSNVKQYLELVGKLLGLLDKMAAL